MTDPLNYLAQAITNQQQTGGQVQTGNPQNVPTSNPQTSLAQNPGLQNAGTSSVDALNALDQGSKTLTVSGVDASVALPQANTTTATVTQPQVATANRNQMVAYTFIGLAVVACFAFLAWGLLKPRTYKPSK